MFSGGSYDEVARWLQNFLTAHAKRENVHAEVELKSGEKREGKSYGARVRLGQQVSGVIELEYPDVARNREGLQWCAGLAARVREVVRDLMSAAA
jgi:predicted ATP-dependent Lon-type protease